MIKINPPTKKLLSKILGALIILITAYFFGRTLIKNWDKIKQHEFDINALIILPSLFFTGAIVVSGFFWGKILSKITGEKISAKFAIQTHINSWFLKYIPGKSGLLIGKVVACGRKDIGKKKAVMSVIYENVFLVISSFVISLPFVSQTILGTDQKYTLLLIATCLLGLLVLIYKPVFRFFINTGLKIIKKQPVGDNEFLKSKDILTFTLFYFVPRIINGFGFAILIMSVTPISATDIPNLIAIYVFSTVVGLLSIFAPSGIGVREGIMTLLLSKYMDVEIAIIISILSRLYMTINDLLLLFFNYIFKLKDKINKKYTK